MIIRGKDIDKAYFTTLLVDVCCGALHINYESKELTITIADKCSAEVSIVWTDVEANTEEGKVNEFIRMLYTATKVCLRVTPNDPNSPAQLASMAQGIGDRAKELLDAYSGTLRQEVYSMAYQQLLKASD